MYYFCGNSWGYIPFLDLPSVSISFHLPYKLLYRDNRYVRKKKFPEAASEEVLLVPCPQGFPLWSLKLLHFHRGVPRVPSTWGSKLPFAPPRAIWAGCGAVGKKPSLCRALPPAPQHIHGGITSAAPRLQGERHQSEFLARMAEQAHNPPAGQMGHTENVGGSPVGTSTSQGPCPGPWPPTAPTLVGMPLHFQ